LVDLTEWSGLVRARTDTFDDLRMTGPVAPSGGSWSGPFRVIASDGNQYFVKSVDTCPPGQQASVAIEHIVAGVGRLIGAPVCTTSLIRIPLALAGWEPRPGIPITEGLAHASLALSHCDEQGRPALAARGQDDNRRRHVGAYALYDWCVGADAQWLYDLDRDRTLYSHDHGLYFPPAHQGYWTQPDMIAGVDIPHELPDPRNDLLASAVDEVAAALDAVKRDELASILNSVPSSWPVTDEDLEALGWFLERRAPAVALRVRALI
jgi:hypothetical protein